MDVSIVLLNLCLKETIVNVFFASIANSHLSDPPYNYKLL